MPVYPLQEKLPQIHQTARIAHNAVVAGDVVVGAESSIWFGAVIRGDVNSVRIGARTNVQDLSCLHVTWKRHDLIIGDEVTIGHTCVIHGCRIEDRCLVGMGSVVMDGVVLGSQCLVGAGSLVTQGMVIPPGTLAFGRPAKVVRDLTEQEILSLEKSAANYVNYSLWYDPAVLIPGQRVTTQIVYHKDPKTQ